MTTLDWCIIAALIITLVLVLAHCRRHVRTAADFLAANRCARRYILCVTNGIAGIGAISIINLFEQYYEAGFSPIWWGFINGAVFLAIAATGWVFYRLRETRCLTMAQFFEMRYSRRFRIFSGMLAWLSGILNYGIFPAVSVKFFIFFCGLPQHFTIPCVPFQFSTYVCLLAVAISIGVSFAVVGGQIAIMMTDFIQGTFCNLVFLVLLVFMLRKFSWGEIGETLCAAAQENPGQSLLNPFATTSIRDFNVWFYLMGILLNVIAVGAWQGNSGYAAAAKSPHEAKMANILSNWRGIIEGLLLLLIPICAYVFYHHSGYAVEAAGVKEAIDNLSGQDISQARVPMFLSRVLPMGLMGLFAAMMCAAMLSTDDTYMHSWGTIFIQDVVMPLRKKPLEPKRHLLMLRLSIVFVGIFAFVFSCLFRQTEYIALYFQITGAIFFGGAGAVVIGGLYSRVGTALGAWVAMSVGSSMSIVSIVLQQTWTAMVPRLQRTFPSWQGWLEANADRFPLNGQTLTFIVTLVGFACYFGVSWLDRRVHRMAPFNMDRMLHRGEYETAGDHVKRWNVGKLWRALGLTEEFSKTDRWIFFVSISWTALNTLWGVVSGMGHFLWHWQEQDWMTMWRWYFCVNVCIGVCTSIIFLCGGIWDAIRLFREIDTAKRDETDDGRVEG